MSKIEYIQPAALEPLLLDKFSDQIEGRTHAKRNGAASYSMLPIVAIGIPCFGGNDTAGICTNDPWIAKHTHAVFVPGNKRRDQCVLDLCARASIRRFVIVAIQFECFFEPVHRRALDDRFSGAGDETAAEALALDSRTAFDLYILDIWLPGMDGVDLCRRLRDRGRAAPIMFFSAMGVQPTDRDYVLAAGANAFLVKSVDLDKLIPTVEQLLASYTASEPDNQVPLAPPN